MKAIYFSFDVFCWVVDLPQCVYLDFFNIQTDGKSGSLFYIGWFKSHWEFDFLFLRNWYYKYKLGMK